MGAVAHPDVVADLGSGGYQVLAPDTAGTRTDAVGPASGFHTGTGLAAMTGTPTNQFAWVRIERAGKPKDSSDNAADFALVSSSTAAVGGLTPTLGSASPTGSTDPYQHNASLLSALLDPLTSKALPPNRTYVAGVPGTLTIRRTITNTTGAALTSAKVRISALSELGGAALPGVAPPATHAQLRSINPATTSSVITVSGVGLVTVNNLSVDAPITGLPGGGLNSTLAVPVPNGGLAPGASISVSFTFAVDSTGPFWFGYDVEAAESD